MKIRVELCTGIENLTRRTCKGNCAHHRADTAGLQKGMEFSVKGPGAICYTEKSGTALHPPRPTSHHKQNSIPGDCKT